MAHDKVLEEHYRLQLEWLETKSGFPGVIFMKDGENKIKFPLTDSSATAIVLFLEKNYKINRPKDGK